MPLMGWVAANLLIGGQAPVPMGNDNFTAAPSGTFKTGSGLLNIAANKQEQFETLARAIGREDLIDDVRFAAREARKQNRAALTEQLESALQQKTAEQWETILTRIGIPAGQVLTVPEALDTPQIRHRKLLQTFTDIAGVGRPVTLTRAGFKMSGGDPEVRSPPPRLGQHTNEVLRELGFADAEIERLKDVGAI